MKTNETTTNLFATNVRMYDIVWVDMDDDTIGNKIGKRPAIVIQNNMANFYGTKTIVILGTTQIKKEHLPCNFILKEKTFGLSKDTMFMCNNIHTIEKNRVVGYIGTIDDADIKKVIHKAYLSNMFCE